MELSCPSCGAKHNTDDFSDAFEVQCACGYSILVPDLSGVDEVGDSQVSGRFSSSPAALDSEDEQLQVSLDSVALDSESPMAHTLSEEMTPPEALPSEMPYDPFELSDLSHKPMEAVDSAFQVPEFEPHLGEHAQEFEASAGISEVDNEIQDEFSTPAIEASPIDESSQEVNEEDSSQTTPAQRIVERVQLAGLGQLLGFSYDLDLLGIGAKEIEILKSRCFDLLKERPWLDAELRKRQFELSAVVEDASLKNLPEPFALELYMTCLELGGRCVFRRSEEP